MIFRSTLNMSQKKLLTITEDKTIKDALIKINKNLQKCLIVVDKNNTLKGAITDGNIRRGFLSGMNLKSKIKSLYTRKNLVYIKENKFSISQAKKELIKNYYNTYIGIIPIINNKKKIIDFFTKEDALSNKQINYFNKKNNKIVVMAGGMGQRLKPFTNILPKPLIPVGDRTALDHIVENFVDNGFNNFLFSINYKSKLLKAYINEIKEKQKIKTIFLEEKRFLGTAGCLGMIDKKIKDDIFIINCDTLIKLDFSSMLNYHKVHKNYITIAVSMKNIQIPYGVFSTTKRGSFEKLIEKPSKRYLVNTGLYLINPKILKLIKKKPIFKF